MAETTSIEWCDATWSPWEGCTKISPACDHCYAAARNGRFSKGANWGPGAPRRKTADWRKPYAWDKAAAAAGKRTSVFPSLCDPFDNEVDPLWRAEFFLMLAFTKNIDWLVLSKRIGNAAAMIDAAIAELRSLQIVVPDWPWPNVWLGATICNQAEADRDVPKLLAVPARVRFLSVEPMLGPVDLTGIPISGHGHHEFDPIITANVLNRAEQYPPLPAISWVIAGAESGPNARPAQIQWFHNLRQQCAAAGVPFHMKQLGHVVHDHGIAGPGQHWPSGIVRQNIPRWTEDDPGFAVTLRHPKGGDMAEWPEDLRVREFPEVTR